MATTINHNLPKKQAILLVKKAVSSKFAVIKDKGDVLTVGTPPLMTAEIIISDTTIEVSGHGAGKIVKSTCASAIQMEIDLAEQSAPAQPEAPVQPAVEQPKAITAEEKKEYISALRELKGLLDDEIITKEEFEIQKADILEKMKGSAKPTEKAESQKEEIEPAPVQPAIEPVPVVEAIKAVEPKIQKELEITKEVEKVTEPIIEADINSRYYKREILSITALIIGVFAFGVALAGSSTGTGEHVAFSQDLLVIVAIFGLLVTPLLSIISANFAQKNEDRKPLFIITLLASSLTLVLSIITILTAFIA